MTVAFDDWALSVVQGVFFEFLACNLRHNTTEGTHFNRGMSGDGWMSAGVANVLYFNKHGDGQAANRKCTAHTRHRTRVRAQVPVGLPWSRQVLQL